MEIKETENRKNNRENQWNKMEEKTKIDKSLARLTGE